VVWFCGIRGVYIASAAILALMIPIFIPTVLAMKKEWVCDPDATGRDLKKAE
jgi:hypothetical protein